MTTNTDVLSEALGENSLLTQELLGHHGILSKRLVNRALRAKWTMHAGDEPHFPEGRGAQLRQVNRPGPHSARQEGMVEPPIVKIDPQYGSQSGWQHLSPSY